jgi:hypothetical protein
MAEPCLPATSRWLRRRQLENLLLEMLPQSLLEGYVMWLSPIWPWRVLGLPVFNLGSNLGNNFCRRESGLTPV